FLPLCAGSACLVRLRAEDPLRVPRKRLRTMPEPLALGPLSSDILRPPRRRIRSSCQPPDTAHRDPAAFPTPPRYDPSSGESCQRTILLSCSCLARPVAAGIL